MGYAFRRTMKRRIGARKVIMKALTAWSRRLRLKWRRAHTACILRFLSDMKRMRISCYAVSRYRHCVVFVQRRARAYHTMWLARYELAQQQFMRVHDVMLQQAARARKGHPMSFRRKDALQRVPRDINDELARNKVVGIEQACSAHAIEQVLRDHLQERKKAHLNAAGGQVDRASRTSSCIGAGDCASGGESCGVC